MGNWAPEGFNAKSEPIRSLKDAVAILNPKAKQAFYAAAQHRTIARGTWNGCAFNAGAEQVGVSGISGYDTAAKVFEMEAKDVSRFISYWDRTRFDSDREATQALREAIEEVGLFSEPKGSASFAGKTFVKVVHKSDLTKTREEFDKMVADLDMDCDNLDDDMHEFKTAAIEAENLLFA